MLKKSLKFLLIMLVVFVLSSSSLICFADEEHEHTNTTTESTTTEEEIHNGDLYLFGNNIVMDKYVDGNAFLFGNNIEITGKINGSLFIFGNNVKFNESVVRYSIFICADSVYYNGYAGTDYDYGNLYVMARNFESTYESLITGDLKILSSKIILRTAVYRNADLISNNIDLGAEKDIPIILGNLNYTSNKEISIPEGVLVSDGTVTFTSSYNIENILIGFGTSLLTVLAIYIILNKLTPKFIEKINDNKFSILSLLKSFGIGLATIAVVLVFFILLLGTMIGVSLAIILTLLFAILYIVATPILIIKITHALKPALKIEKTSMFYLVIILLSTVLHGITLIPLVGGILGLIINITAIGLIVRVFLPKKELTEEQIMAIEEKAKRKQEKLEAKAEKKQKSLEIKLEIKKSKQQEKLKIKPEDKNN